VAPAGAGRVPRLRCLSSCREEVGDEQGGSGVGRNGSIDGEVVEWHLIYFLLGKVEVLDDDVGGLTRDLRISPAPLMRPSSMQPCATKRG
jgi:hypothetical protein